MVLLLLLFFFDCKTFRIYIIMWHLILWWKWSHSVMSNSLWPHGLQPTRFLSPWNFPGKSTGVGCHFLLQGIFPTQWSNPSLRHCRQTLYHLSHQESPLQFSQKNKTAKWVLFCFVLLYGWTGQSTQSRASGSSMLWLHLGNQINVSLVLRDVAMCSSLFKQLSLALRRYCHSLFH